MGTVTRVAVVAGAAAAALVAALLVLGHDARAPAERPAAQLTVRATVTPPVAGFGDRLVARVAVLVDPRTVDSGHVRVSENLAPLTPLGPLRARRSAGALVFELPVSCLAAACTTDAGARSVVLPAVQVEAPRRSGGTVRAQASWPVLEVRSRVLSAEVDVRRTPHFRANLSLPRLRYAVSPSTLGPLLDALAVMLALAGVALVAWYALSYARGPRTEGASELALALALARDSRGRAPSDRRRALGLVARVLGERDEPLSSPARALAWSRPQPGRDELAELVERVSREVQP
jgi:hypothetical protein